MIADAVGTYGMVGGQAADLEFQHKEPDLPTIEYINTHKTGSLIAVSVRVGGYLGVGSPSQVEALYRYGRSVGLLFQIVDDILDHEGYANTIGIPEARQEAETLCQKAKSYLRPFGQNGHALGEIADFVLRRTF
jgi:geranylgeranyl diphosphate synthase type II